MCKFHDLIPLCPRFNDYYIGVKIASLAARTIHLFFMVQLKVRAAKVHVACVAYLGRPDYLWRIAVAPRSLEFRAQVRAVHAPSLPFGGVIAVNMVASVAE